MKPIRYYVFGGITAGLLTCMAVNANAQTAAVPRQMSYQGVLREGDKVVADGKHTLQFKLYTTESGGQPIWQETQLITMTGGLFNVTLGIFVDLPAIIPKDAWIGISIDNSSELIPRTKLMSAPYSFNAGTAQSLSPTATGAVLSVNGQQGAIELRAADGLEVRSEKGVLTIGKSSQVKEDEVLNQGTEWLLAGNAATNNHWLGTNNNFPLIIRTNNAERMRILSSNGNVGIGETAPTSRLTVARTLHITNTGGTPELRLSAPSGVNGTTFKTTGQSANITYTLPPDDGDANDVLISNGSGVLTWADNGWLRDGNSDITSNKFIGTTNNQPFIVKTNNIERYRVTGGGAIGINEDNPIQKLEVAGNILVKVDGNNTGELRFQEPPGFMGNNYVGLKAGSVVNNIVFTLPSSYPTQPGQVLSSSPSGVMTWITPDDGGGGSGLLYFEESRHTSSPNDGVPAHRFAAIGADNNIDVVLSPKGVGSLIAQLPDDTDAGGFKRGWRSVDWQMVRTDASGVAGGDFSVISGGAGNSVYGGYSVVSGGFLNVVEGTASNISGGVSNTVAFDAENSGIVSGLSNQIGGNESGSQASSILGGVNNLIYGDNTSILGGRGLTLDGSGSFGFHANYYDDHFESEDYTRDMAIEENNTAVFGNVDLWLANNDGTPRSLRFYEQYDAPGDFPNGSSYVGFKAPNSIASDVTWTLPDADGTSGQVLSTNGSGTLSWNTVALQYFTEARNTTAANATVPVHQFAASGTEANIDIALTPKGAGALTAQVADGTATGGDKRGTNAVDWQMVRVNATEVASGLFSTISGGTENAATGWYSTIGGGWKNSANGSRSTVAGGRQNSASGINSTVGGGALNITNHDFSTVAGGYSHTASGIASTVSGGYENTAAGDNSSIIGGSRLTLDANADRSFGFNGNTSAGDRAMTISAANTAVFGNVDLWLASNDNAPRSLRFYEQYNTAGDFPNGSNYVGFRAPNSIAADVTWTLPDADGTSGQVLSTNGAGVLNWTTAGGGLTHFTESLHTTGQFSTTNAGVRLLAANGTATNIDMALTPKGNGALTAHIADGSVNGGNKRGQYAVDWQTFRSAASQVASGHLSTVSGGIFNTASGASSTVSGGTNNTASDSHSTVSGGEQNTASGHASTVSGGTNNTASNFYSTVGGGVFNTASGYLSTVSGGQVNTASDLFSTVSGGQVNTASGSSSTVSGGEQNAASGESSTVSGGYLNTASGSNSTVSGGQQNTASSSISTVSGGEQNTASGIYSTVSGGLQNTASGSVSTVSGGYANTANGDYSAIAGGRGLTLDANANRSFGFHGNTAAGDRAMTISAANTAVFGNVDLWLASNDNTPRSLRFYEQYDAAGAFPNGSNYVGFRAPNSIAADVTYTLPDAAPTSNGQVLSSTTAGTLSWSLNKVTVNYDPANVASNSFADFTITVTGVVTTDAVHVSRAGGFGNLVVASVYVSAADEVTVRVYNPTGTGVDLSDATLYIGINR